MSNKYKIIYNNQIFETTDKQFQETQSLLQIPKVTKEIFNNLQQCLTNDYNYKMEIISKSLGIIFNNETCFTISLLKNSGSNSKTNKRIAITEKHYHQLIQKFKYIYPIAVLLISDKSDDLVYFLVANSKKFIEKYTINTGQTSYSSFWLNSWETFVNYLKLWKKWDEKNETLAGVIAEMPLKRHRSPHTENFRNYLITKNLNELIFKMKNINNDPQFTTDQNVENTKEKYNLNELSLDEIIELIEEYSLPYNFNWESDSEEVKAEIKTRRNHGMSELYLQQSKKCELCKIESTFKMESGKEYFEIHHFIPCNLKVQNSYLKKLDNYLNLVSLCPTCHRLLHFVNNKQRKEILGKIFNEKFSKTDFIKIYKEFNLDKLCEQYNETYKLNLEGKNGN